MPSTILSTEYNARAFLAKARACKRIWQGFVETLHRLPDEGIHGACAYELVSCHLTSTKKLPPTESGWNVTHTTLTTLTFAAQRELMSQLTRGERTQIMSS